MRYAVSDAKVAWRIVDGEGVLLHAESSAYYGLNRIGTVLWEQLAATPMSVDELAAWTASALAHNGRAMRNDIEAFLEHLTSMDLLEKLASNGGAVAAAVPVDLAGLAWEAPVLLPFGELEKLILSGE